MWPVSSLMSTAWDYVFQLVYQSTDESMPSEDEHGGINPDTDEEKNVRKKPLAKAKGKWKAPSKEPWITHHENYHHCWCVLHKYMMSTQLNQISSIKPWIPSMALHSRTKNSAVVIHISLVVHVIEICHMLRWVRRYPLVQSILSSCICTPKTHWGTMEALVCCYYHSIACT